MRDDTLEAGARESAADTRPIEPDRFELREAARYRFRFTRREFLGTIGAVGAGVVVLVTARGTPVIAELPDGALQERTGQISAWLHIDEAGRVTVFTGKVEVGQDIRTSLAQAVAEELAVAPESITLVMGDTDRTPYDAGTFGSRSTPQMGTQLRRAAAAARTTLLRLAAEQSQSNVSALTLTDGRIVDRNRNRSYSIGEITRGEQLVQAIDADTAVRPASDWRIAGTSLPKVAGRDIVTGRHRFTPDMKLPNMLIGRVLRPPAFGATIASVNTTAASAIEGAVVVHDGEFIGVAAPDAVTADRALARIDARWNHSPQPSHRDVFAHLKRTAQSGRPNERGSVDAALASAGRRIEASYTASYIAHVPLEPRAAVAVWENGKLTVWTGTQRPFGVRTELARAFRVPEEQVRVLVPDTGSAYGGKHTGDAAIEAARLARAANRPVKIVWTREEEFTWAYFRPGAVIDVRSAADADGTIAAWDFTTYNAGTSGIAMPYEARNSRTTYNPSDTPLRQGSYRALAATANNFARETHIDEIATQLGVDPLEFRLRNLRESRMRAVLEAAAERIGWQTARASGRGIGIACGTEKGGFVATCAEVEVDRSSGRVSVLRLVEAFECGAIVNPDGLHNQVEGSIVMGLGGALWEMIEFEEGRVLNPRLSQYRVPRHSDIPPIDIVLLDRKDLPSAGAGETPIITIAPAIGNAVFAASGVRLRSLPLNI